MKRTLIAIASLAAAVSLAHAGILGGDNNSTNQTTTNVNANTNANTNTNVNSATGGKGGEGGDVYRSGNSNVNVDANSSVKNSGNSVNVNANDQAQRQRQSQSQAQSQSVDGSGNSYVSISEPRQPVNSAIAAGLTASVETCMGSTSMGAQGVGFGLSFGTTWEDDACQARMDARTLTGFGYADAARARLCASEGIREAFKASGQPCPQDAPQSPVAAVDRAATVVSAETLAPAFVPMSPIPNP